ncbi:MAG: LysM peptidoglycan-binding domain-containing protein [Acidobacteriota bacterium]
MYRNGWREPGGTRLGLGRRLSRAALALALASVPAFAGAQETPTSDAAAGPSATETPRTQEGWYVVRQGDTLEGLSQRFLGDASRWRENARLNPQLDDPNRLRPGERLRLLYLQLPTDAAVVAGRSNRVEGRMPPVPWRETEVDDLLRWRDAVRTFEESSAELRFADDSLLRIGEESLILLDAERSEPVRRREPADDTIEIVVGQADLARAAGDRRAAAPAGEEIRIVVGEAVARPSGGDEGEVEARVRKADDGGAQLMVFAGASDLAAGGRSVAVAEGMGSITAVGEPPSEPERLLPAPELIAPDDGARRATGRPELSWRPIDGAASYVVEVCRDADCGQLVARDDAVSAELGAWRPSADLPIEALFWRVAARAPSGLDGYAAQARTLNISSNLDDRRAPDLALGVDGRSLPPRPNINDRWIFGPATRLRLEASDVETAVAETRYVLDGADTTADAWRGPWTPGEHLAVAESVDEAGNVARVERAFVFDVEPPGIVWGIEGEGPRAEVANAPEDPGQLDEPPSRRVERFDDPHSFWPWRKIELTIRRDPRQILIRPKRELRVTVDEKPVDLGPERGLWILSNDAVCLDPEILNYRLQIDRVGRGWRGKRARIALTLEVADPVGNRTTGELVLETRGRR